MPRPLPLLRACHLPPTVAVTSCTTVLAAAAGRTAVGAVAVAAAVLAGQLAVGWTNDLVDRDRDRAAGRTDKPVATGEVEAPTVALAAGTALAAAVPLSFLSGWRAGSVHLLAVALGLGHDLGLKAGPASPLPWFGAFAALPAFVTLGLPGHPSPPAWAVAAGALLGGGAHFLNVLPDLDDDVRAGVRGLPHRLGRRPSLLVGAGLLAAAVVVLTVGPPEGPGTAGLALAVAALGAVAALTAAALGGRERWAWHLTLVVAGLAVASFLVRGDALAPS